MKWSKSLASATLLSTAIAQEMSLCDMYTTALLKNNTAANQYTLLTLVVNTALIGNYTEPNVGIKVNGILVPGEYNGVEVNLLPYFNGGLISTNRGGKPTAVNFIDGGGAIPLAKNMPADADKMGSNQYKLVTHLYQYFGTLLGCSGVGEMGFPAYNGTNKQYELHKHMNLDPNEMNYFITQVGMSAASFGVSMENVTYIANALNSTFNYRCTPAVAVLPDTQADLQAICINEACPLPSTGAVCSNYNTRGGFGVDPMTASSTIGPQLSDLAAQLSTIAMGTMTGGMAMATTGTTVITSGGSTITSVFTSSMPMETGSMSDSMSVMTTTTNVETVITSVVTSGSSTITNLVTTSTAVETVVSGTGNAAPIQTAAIGMMALAGACGVIGQML